MISTNPATKNEPTTTGSPSAPSVSQLVERAWRGDRGAFGTLYERYVRYVKTIALRILRSEADADEVCQEVFIQAMEKLSQLKDPACFGGWLGSIAHRKSLNHKAKRRCLLVGDSPLLEYRGDETSLPAEQAIATEQARMVRANVKQLRPLDRTTLVAFYFQGQTLAEMSDQFDAPLGTIKRRLHVARKRLAQQIEAGVAV